MIIKPVFHHEDVSQGMYDRAGRIYIASAYGYNVYDNELYKIAWKQHRMKILSSICVVPKEDTLLNAVEFN